MHAEIKIDDSVLMFGTASEAFQSNSMMTHIYVNDVDATFQKAIDAGCQAIEKPRAQPDDPDRRGGFNDFAGNSWWISTQDKKD